MMKLAILALCVLSVSEGLKHGKLRKNVRQEPVVNTLVQSAALLPTAVFLIGTLADKKKEVEQVEFDDIAEIDEELNNLKRIDEELHNQKMAKMALTGNGNASHALQHNQNYTNQEEDEHVDTVDETSQLDEELEQQRQAAVNFLGTLAAYDEVDLEGTTEKAYDEVVLEGTQLDKELDNLYEMAHPGADQSYVNASQSYISASQYNQNYSNQEKRAKIASIKKSLGVLTTTATLYGADRLYKNLVKRHNRAHNNDPGSFLNLVREHEEAKRHPQALMSPLATMR